MNVQTAEGPVDFGERLERECSAIGQFALRLPALH